MATAAQSDMTIYRKLLSKALSSQHDHVAGLDICSIRLVSLISWDPKGRRSYHAQVRRLSRATMDLRQEGRKNLHCLTMRIIFLMTDRLWYAIWKETPAHFLRGFKIKMLGTPFTTVATHSTPSEQYSITLA